MSGINFSAVSAFDINTIIRIEEDSFLNPWSHVSFINELTCNHAFLFSAKYKDKNEEERIIAYVCYRIIDSEIHILKIAVENSWRRLGVASRLLSNTINELSSRDIHAVFLEVRCSNTAAISLYHKLGFSCIGRRHNYYSNSNSKEDALLMKKVLKEAK